MVITYMISVVINCDTRAEAISYFIIRECYYGRLFIARGKVGGCL
jgi:hypothetical protein